MTRYEARSLIKTYSIPVGISYYQLTPLYVERLLIVADLVRYKKPISYKGSRGEVFYNYLMKRAEYNKE